MSGFNQDTNPSILGGGAPGVALQLLGGGAGVSGGTGMVGGSTRGVNRFTLRQAFKTNNINPARSPFVQAVCGPFRAAFMAGDKLGRFQQTDGGANQVTTVRRAANAGWKGLAGSVSARDSGKTVSIGGLTFTTGLADGQTPIQSGNPKYVYDGSDFARFKRLSAINKNYNDSSFGGPSKADIGGSGVSVALGRVRH